MIKVSEDFPWI